MPLEWGMDLATQVDELRAGGSRVETVFPDGGAGDVFDANASDPSTRLQAARGGYDQGRALAELLAEIWRGRPKPVDSVSNAGTCSCLGWPMGATCLTLPSCALTWARSAGLTNLACRSWDNGSSSVVRCWPAGSSRPTSSPGGVAVAAARLRRATA